MWIRTASILLLGVICLVFSITAYAQEPDPEILQRDEQIAVLQAQLETMREYRQDLVEIVQASFWGTVAVLLFVLGYNVFTNWRTLRSERASLRQEQARALAELRQELQAVTRQGLDQPRETSKAELTSLLAPELERWSKAQAEARREVNQVVSRLDQKLLQHDYRFMQIEAEKWENDPTGGGTNNALIVRMQLLESSLNHQEFHSYIGANLVAVRDYLLTLEQQGRLQYILLQAITIGNYRKILAQVPGEYAAEVESVHDLLNRIAAQAF